MTARYILEVQNMLRQMNVQPISTEYGDFWIMEIPPERWRELMSDSIFTTQTTYNNAMLDWLKNWVQPRPALPAGFEYMYGSRPFHDIVGICGSIAIRICRIHAPEIMWEGRPNIVPPEREENVKLREAIINGADFAWAGHPAHSAKYYPKEKK